MNVPQPLPTQYIERITEMYSAEEVEQLLAATETKRPTTFRVNTLKARAADVAKELRAHGFDIEQVNWYQDAFILRNKGLRDLEEEALYQTGAIYVQGLSSMVPALLLEPNPGESILDIAAAPGSKTTQIAALMQNEGMILANDTSRVRIFKLQSNLEKQGVSCVTIKHGLGERVWQDFPGVFDKALVDVPCSMEGRFYVMKPKTLDNWSERKVKELAKRQQQLLRSAWSSLSVGGTLVYSTCTMSPEENEGVIDWLLKKEKEKVTVLPITLAGEFWHEPLQGWQGKKYHSSIADTKRILSSADYEGFFVAKLQKLG